MGSKTHGFLVGIELKYGVQVCIRHFAICISSSNQRQKVAGLLGFKSINLLSIASETERA